MTTVYIKNDGIDVRPELIFLKDSHFDEVTDPKVINDLREIVEIFRTENVSLEGWNLEEIPIAGCYCFRNSKDEYRGNTNRWLLLLQE